MPYHIFSRVITLIRLTNFYQFQVEFFYSFIFQIDSLKSILLVVKFSSGSIFSLKAIFFQGFVREINCE